MQPKDIFTLTLSSCAFLISLLNFLLPKYQDWKTGQGSIIKALYGDEQAVAYIAYKVKNYRWTKRFVRVNTRKDIIAALCLGWTLESTDRTKALIYDSLREIKEQGFEGEISHALQDILRRFNQYHAVFNPTHFCERMEGIKKLLEEIQK
jgi:hypothetical protein